MPSSSLAYSAQSSGAGPLILIAGRVEVPTARLLTAIGAHSPTRLLVAIAADQWAQGATSPPRSSASGRRRRGPGLVPSGWLAHHAARADRLRRGRAHRVGGRLVAGTGGVPMSVDVVRPGVRAGRGEMLAARMHEGRWHAGIVGGLAVLMGSLCVQPLLDGAWWLTRTIVVVAIIVGVGGLTRSLRLPAPLAPLLQFAALLVTLALLFARDEARWGIVPGPAAFARLRELAAQGRDYSMATVPPAGPDPGAAPAHRRRDRPGRPRGGHPGGGPGSPRDDPDPAGGALRRPLAGRTGLSTMVGVPPRRPRMAGGRVGPPARPGVEVGPGRAGRLTGHRRGHRWNHDRPGSGRWRADDLEWAHRTRGHRDRVGRWDRGGRCTWSPCAARW